MKIILCPKQLVSKSTRYNFTFFRLMLCNILILVNVTYKTRKYARFPKPINLHKF